MSQGSYFVQQASTCERRRLDADRISAYLEENGYKRVGAANEADIIVAVTCSTTNSNIEESVVLVGELAAQMPASSRMMVTGCLDKKVEVSALAGKHVIRLNPQDGLSTLQEFLQLASSPYDIPDVNLVRRGEVQVRVQNGCSGSCTFCDLPQKIGRTKSRTVAAVLADIDALMNERVTGISVCGDDVGSFGRDTGTSLAELLLIIASRYADKHILIDNLDPKYLVRDWKSLESLIKGGRIKYIKLPVQHFNQRILRAMHRFDDLPAITNCIEALGRHDVLIRSHFIYAFPTETLAELVDAVKVVTSLPFGEIEFLPYSNKALVAASRLPQLEVDIIRLHMSELKSLLLNSGQTVSVKHADTNGIEELVWSRHDYLRSLDKQ